MIEINENDLSPECFESIIKISELKGISVESSALSILEDYSEHDLLLLLSKERKK